MPASHTLRSRSRSAYANLESLVRAEKAACSELLNQVAPSVLKLGPHIGAGGAPEPAEETHLGNTAATTHTDCSEGGTLTSLEHNILHYESALCDATTSIIRESNSISRPETLHFLVEPTHGQQSQWQKIHDDVHHHSESARSHKYDFVLSEDPENREFFRSECVLRESLRQISAIVQLMGARTTESGTVFDIAEKARQVAIQALSQLMIWKEDVWNWQLAARSHNTSPPDKIQNKRQIVDTAPFINNSNSLRHHPLVLSSVVHVVLSNLIFGLPVKGCEMLLSGFRHHTQIAVDYSQGALHPSLPLHIPKTISTAFQQLDLNPALRQYIVCPKCHWLYPGMQPYPLRCTNIPSSGASACQATLLVERRSNGKAIHYPIRSYVHQDFKLWLARFLSRPNIVALLRSSQSPNWDQEGVVSDILESAAIRQLLGPDRLPFLRAVDGQYRLLFALSVDGFNPLTNKVAKQVRTSTGIYLICLNLPLAVRQLPHNMFLVGVVPGPSKLKEGELNHYLDLLVSDLMPFWSPGVLYTSTALDPTPVLCFAAIVAVICDALAAREVSGFCTITSMQFCIYCSLPLSEIEDFDFKNWPRRACAEHRVLAEDWRTASLSDRLIMQKKSHPARYTALLRLEYFDPIQSTVIDTMHLLLIGDFERHCRNVWGMNATLDDGDGSKRGMGVVPSPPSQEDLDAGRLIVISGNVDDFRKRGTKKDVLYFLCQENGLRTGGKKRDLVNELKTFMSKKATQLGSQPLSSTPTEPSRRITNEPLSLRNLPTVTEAITSQFTTAEERLSKGESLTRCPNNPLKIMCYLRCLTFQTQAPVKAVMIAALFEWRRQQLILDPWVPTMQLHKLQSLALDQKKLAQKDTVAANEARSASGLAQVAASTALHSAAIVDSGTSPSALCDLDNQRSHKGSAPKRKQSAVLGVGILDEYVADRREMVIPYWITAPPKKAGHANQGKMSADQWRAFCTLNLPVTLIRIWSAKPSEPRWYQMLMNFLDLVLAVEIASLVVTSEELIQQYERLMQRYLSTLKSLYKDAPVSPNQHISLHVGDVMRKFGPTPGYRTFATERFNFILQKVETNRHEFGEMERIMTRSVCRASNLAALLEHPHALPSHLRGTASGVLEGGRRGTRAHDVPFPTEETTRVPQFKHATFSQSQLPDDCLDALVQYLNRSGENYVSHKRRDQAIRSSELSIYSDVTVLRILAINGVCYRPCHRSLGSSNVIARLGDGSYKPAQIQTIFRHARRAEGGRKEEDFLALRFLRPLSLSDQLLDPYRTVNEFYEKEGPFKEPFGSLWSTHLEEAIYVVRPHDLLCHFARTAMTLETISEPCFHVNALSKLKTLYELNGWINQDDMLDDAMGEHETDGAV